MHFLNLCSDAYYENITGNSVADIIKSRNKISTLKDYFSLRNRYQVSVEVAYEVSSLFSSNKTFLLRMCITFRKHR